MFELILTCKDTCHGELTKRIFIEGYESTAVERCCLLFVVVVIFWLE